MLSKQHQMKNLLQQEGVWDSESLGDSDTEELSQSETVVFAEEALDQADLAEPRRGGRARIVPDFFGEVRTHIVVTEGDYVEHKTVCEAEQNDHLDHWHRAMKDSRCEV